MENIMTQMEKRRPTERLFGNIGGWVYASPALILPGRACVDGLCTSALCVVLAWVKLWPGHEQALGLHCAEMALGCFSGMELLNFCQCPASLTFDTSYQLVNERTQISLNAPLCRSFRFNRGAALSWPGQLVGHPRAATEPTPFMLRHWSAFSGLRLVSVGRAGWKKRSAVTIPSFLLLCKHVQACSKYHASHNSLKPLGKSM